MEFFLLRSKYHYVFKNSFIDRNQLRVFSATVCFVSCNCMYVKSYVEIKFSMWKKLALEKLHVCLWREKCTIRNVQKEKNNKYYYVCRLCKISSEYYLSLRYRYYHIYFFYFLGNEHENISSWRWWQELLELVLVTRGNSMKTEKNTHRK